MFNWSRLISNEDLTGKPETLSDNNTQNQPQIINPEGPMSTFSIDDIDSPKTVSPQPQEQSEEDITPSARKINLSDAKAYAHYLQLTPTDEENPNSLSGSPEILYSRLEGGKDTDKDPQAGDKTATNKGSIAKPLPGSSPASPFEEMLGDINSFGNRGPPGISSPSGDSGIAVMVGSTSSSIEDVITENGHAGINGRPSAAAWAPQITEAEKIEWQAELDKIEDEIKTLRQVLQVKMRRSSELKRQLGITPLAEIQTTLKTIQESDAYQKTTTTLKSAGQKTGVALTTAGTSVKSKFGEIRKSPSFQSFQERMNTTYNKIAGKSQRYSRIRTSQSEQNFGDILGGGRRPDSLNVDDNFQSASVPTTPTL